MKRRLHYRDQPAHCACQHASDTAEWHGKRRSGAGLTGRGASLHLSGCVHSTLAQTTAPLPKRRKVRRLALAHEAA